ncbi:YetF domain-containing protein, partial [Neobacillus niacini]|uniref:YetF domain-containing protein n=1 Tax=Neobacillus niacini TaxID=86668 RepID=UPI002FFE06AE
ILPNAETVPIELVYNGNILYDNLLKHTYDEEWLMGELTKRNLFVKDISYAVLGTKGNLYIDLFRDQID